MTQSSTEEKMTIDVLDYLGKHESGVIALLSLGYKGDYYESVFFYQEELVALTPDDKLESEIGSVIEDWVGYNELMLDIIKRVVPYNEIINTIDDFNPDSYGLYLTQSSVDN